ncbi:Cobyric acid synthase [bacterium HR40]|nr:Cobyric acid synthase [bacterium HR40]
MRPTPALMFQATCSNAGKSLIVAGLCRAYQRRGLRVLPFKPQNMSNNAAPAEGGEIGRAQALQARAARVPPSVHMNPVLLKPESESGAQVVVHGRRRATVSARDYQRLKPSLLAEVLASFHRLEAEAELLLVEGAGSAAEVNLRAGDIANMGFALAAGVPVVLVGDIDRGGVIAALVGTHRLLAEDERRLLGGYVINKFRGDPTLFSGALPRIEEETGLACLGIVPWFADARLLPAEDALGLEERSRRGPAPIHIAVPKLPRIANFDDLDPLAQEPDVALALLDLDEPLPVDTDLVLLPGSKAVIDDLLALRASGFASDIYAHVRRGGWVLGICGGYQMLGRSVADPHGLEGPPRTVPGLGLLAHTTLLLPDKQVRAVSGREYESGFGLTGYEIHLGRSERGGDDEPWLEIEGRPEGSVRRDRRVFGTYVHGLFANDAFRRAFLARLRPDVRSRLDYEARIEDTLDRLADHLEAAIDLDRLYRLAETRTRPAATVATSSENARRTSRSAR